MYIRLGNRVIFKKEYLSLAESVFPVLILNPTIHYLNLDRRGRYLTDRKKVVRL